MDSLQQISDGSLDNITFPGEFMNATGIKEEPQDFELTESEFDAHNFVQTELYQPYPDVETDVLKKNRKKKRKNNVSGVISGEQKKPKAFKCNICGKGYSGLSGLHYHKSFVHEGKKPFSCVQCSKTFTSKSGLQYHVTIEHELRELGINDSNINEHINHPKVAEILQRRGKLPRIAIEQEEKLYKCEFCDKSFNLNQGLIRHVQKDHEGTAISRCHICLRKFQSEKSLQIHIKMKHDNKLTSQEHIKEFECELCGKGYKSKKELSKHAGFAHEGKKPFSCNMCPKKFTTKHSLQYHSTLTHELKELGIDEKNINEHRDNPKVAEILRIREHTPKKVDCKLCGKELQGAAERTVHVRDDHCDKDGNFKCPKCNLTFRKYNQG